MVKTKVYNGSFSILALLLVALMLAVGCGSTNEVFLDTDNNGEQIEVKQDQFIVIELEGNPSTGFDWEVKEVDEAILTLVGEREYEFDSKLLGAPGVVTFRFEVVKAGETTLELIYHRAWEEEVAPLEIFSVNIMVK